MEHTHTHTHLPTAEGTRGSVRPRHWVRDARLLQERDLLLSLLTQEEVAVDVRQVHISADTFFFLSFQRVMFY